MASSEVLTKNLGLRSRSARHRPAQDIFRFPYLIDLSRALTVTSENCLKPAENRLQKILENQCSLSGSKMENFLCSLSLFKSCAKFVLCESRSGHALQEQVKVFGPLFARHLPR